MSRTTTHDISGEILLGIFRAVYGDLQVFRNTSTITTGPGGPGGPGGPSYYDYDDDDEDGEDDDYMSREEYRMLNMAIANSIETMPEFDFTSRNEKIVLNVSSRTVAEEEVNTLCCGVCLENYRANRGCFSGQSRGRSPRRLSAPAARRPFFPGRCPWAWSCAGSKSH